MIYTCYKINKETVFQRFHLHTRYQPFNNATKNHFKILSFWHVIDGSFTNMSQTETTRNNNTPASYSSTLKPYGTKVLSLFLQNSSLLVGSDGSVLSIKTISTSLIKPLWPSLKKWSWKYFCIQSSPLSAFRWQDL